MQGRPTSSCRDAFAFHIYGDTEESVRTGIGTRVVRRLDGGWRTVAVQNTDVARPAALDQTAARHTHPVSPQRAADSMRASESIRTLRRELHTTDELAIVDRGAALPARIEAEPNEPMRPFVESLLSHAMAASF